MSIKYMCELQALALPEVHREADLIPTQQGSKNIWIPPCPLGK